MGLHTSIKHVGATEYPINIQYVSRFKHAILLTNTKQTTYKIGNHMIFKYISKHTNTHAEI